MDKDINKLSITIPFYFSGKNISIIYDVVLSEIDKYSDDFIEWGFGNPTIDEKFRNIKVSEVLINKIAFIAANSAILPDVEIGEGAAFGAGYIVTKNLEPLGIYIWNNKQENAIKKKYKRNLKTF